MRMFDSPRARWWLGIGVAAVVGGAIGWWVGRVTAPPRPLAHVVVVAPHRAIPAAVPAPGPRAPTRHGRLAIVLDDWGYSQQLVPQVLQLPGPVTLAILPHRPYSKAIAEAVRGSSCEVILHMPMESSNAHSAREPHILTPPMSAAQVRQSLDEALATVPRAVGVSNHQGSKATEDPVLMRLVLEDLHRRHLLFLDSLSTSRSVCRDVAHQVQIPYARRAVFLDNEETPAAVRRQLLRAAALAQRTGQAVAIGHDKRVTLQVLQELMPQLAQEGIEFVRISEVAAVP